MEKKKQPAKPAPKILKPKKKAERPAGPALKVKLDQWCHSGRKWVIISIILVSAVFRIIYFQQVSRTHLLNEHAFFQSDMWVFDEWARDIAGGDLLSSNYAQPEHAWMKWIADRYFTDNPDKLKEYQRIAGPDTTKNTPARALWSHWYGQHVFPHEPLYTYFVALNYKLFGHDVSWVFIWQLLIGILSNLLIYLITRRYFGDLAGCIAALMAIFFGPLLFLEMVLLRSSLAVFCGLLVVWFLGTALIKNAPAWWIASGAATGLSMMVHGYMLLFFIVWIIFLTIRFFHDKKSLAISVVMFTAGVLIAISPVMIRNLKVGAPPFSMSNNSAVGFISMNDKPFHSYAGWALDIQIASDIMGQSDGKLIKAIIPTLKTHDSPGSYLKQVWEKLQATFSWYEIQNNVNYYFYRELAPILRWTFLSFLIISPLAIAGLFLSFIKKVNPWPLYLILLVYLAAMLGFMVLSRYRIVFAGALIPFAAYTVSCLFESRKGIQNWLIIGAVAVLAWWCSNPAEENISRVVKSDYLTFWSIHYYPEASEAAKMMHFSKATFLFRDFIGRYEPSSIKNLEPYYRCKTKDESEIFSFFADVHGNLGGIYNYVGLRGSGQREMELSNQLKNAAGVR